MQVLEKVYGYSVRFPLKKLNKHPHNLQVQASISNIRDLASVDEKYKYDGCNIFKHCEKT